MHACLHVEDQAAVEDEDAKFRARRLWHDLRNLLLRQFQEGTSFMTEGLQGLWGGPGNLSNGNNNNNNK